MNGSGFIVLLVEDDPDDVYFVQEAFKKAGMPEILRVARDGEEAVSYLLGEDTFADRKLYPLPSLMLLDLKLPRKSGFEVLEWRRKQPGFKHTPILVLTSSQSDMDITRAYDLGANSYLVKPLDSSKQLEMVKAIRAFWIELNRTPAPASRQPL